MALKYTGRARTLNWRGKIYAEPKLYAKNPAMYDGSFDKPIPHLSKEEALNLIEVSNMHSFEDVSDEEDLLEKETRPIASVPDGDISTVKAAAIKG